MWQKLPGSGLWVPNWPWNLSNSTMSMTAGTNLTANAHKFALIGDFAHADGGSKTITKIHTRIGSNTSFSGTLTGYVQGVSTTSGPPATPDGSTTSGAAFATLTAATWQSTDAFSTGYSATVGTPLAVVFEITSFSSGSIAPASGVTGAAATSAFAQSPQMVANPATSWALATLNMLPNVILECSDGSFGTIEGAFPAEAISSVSYHSGTAAADEYGLRLQFPVPVKIDAAWVFMSSTSASVNFSFVLSNLGSDEVRTIDGNQINATSVARFRAVRFAQEVELAAGTPYVLSLRPESAASNIGLNYFDVNAAAHWACHAGGAELYMMDRVDGGSWGTGNSNAGKRRPMMGARISSIHDGTGAGRASFSMGY